MGEGLKSIEVEVTTASNGTGNDTAERPIDGAWLYAIQWIDGDFDDGVDAVISFTTLGKGADVTVLTLTNANDDKWYYPRTLEHDETGADLTTRGFYAMDGSPKVTITDGGDVKTGSAIFWYFE